MATIHFIPGDKTISVADGTNLLEAARNADVFIAAPCDGSGTCGKCRVKIPAAQRQNFKEAPHDWLTRAERAEGWVLACQSTVHGDLQVEPDQCADDELKILSEGQAVPSNWILGSPRRSMLPARRRA
jgi:ferredoxin